WRPASTPPAGSWCSCPTAASAGWTRARSSASTTTRPTADVCRFDADEHAQTLAIALVRQRVTAEAWRPARDAVGVVCTGGGEAGLGRAGDPAAAADRAPPV